MVFGELKDLKVIIIRSYAVYVISCSKDVTFLMNLNFESLQVCRSKLLELIAVNAYKKGDFTLSSGKKSPPNLLSRLRGFIGKLYLQQPEAFT